MLWLNTIQFDERVEFSDRAKFHNKSLSGGEGYSLYGICQDYSTDDNIWIMSPLWSPTVVYDLVKVEPIVVSPEYTTILYRLADKNDEQYVWDGTDWTLDDINGNTLTELNSGLPSWDIDDGLRLVCILGSDDGTATPIVRGFNILSNIRDGYTVYDDIVDGVVTLLEDMEYIKDWTTELYANDTTRVPLPNCSPYDVVEITGVYNYTDDPNLKINIFDSYDSQNNEIVLTNAVDDTKQLWMRFKYSIPAHFATHRDYSIVNPPCYVIDAFVPVVNGVLKDSRYVKDDRGKVLGYNTFTNVARFALSISVVTQRFRDFTQIINELQKKMKKDPYLYLPLLDQRCSILYSKLWNDFGGAAIGETIQGNFELSILDVTIPINDVQEHYLVTKPVNVDFCS